MAGQGSYHLSEPRGECLVVAYVVSVLPQSPIMTQPGHLRAAQTYDDHGRQVTPIIPGFRLKNSTSNRFKQLF